MAKHDSSLSKYGIFNEKLINDILCNNYEILRNHQNKPKFILNSTNFLEIFQFVYLLEQNDDTSYQSTLETAQNPLTMLKCYYCAIIQRYYVIIRSRDIRIKILKYWYSASKYWYSASKCLNFVCLLRSNSYKIYSKPK